MGRAAPLFVAWSLGLCLFSAGAYLLIFPILVPGQTWFTTAPLGSWLLERIPGWIYNLLVRCLFLIAFYSFLAAMTIALVAGPRALRARLMRRGVTLSLCGLLLATLHVGGPLFLHAQFRRSAAKIHAEAKVQTAELQRRLETGNVKEERRDRMWQLYAGAMYREEGIQVQIPDASGRLVAWQPSDVDVTVRRWYLEILDRPPPMKHVQGAATWVALCLGVGLLWPLRRRSNSGDASAAQSAPPHNPGTGTAEGE